MSRRPDLLPMHTLLFHEPGHFHAALLLKSVNPRVARTVHVYATPGPDLDRFVSLVNGFNARPDDPTDWLLELHTEPGPGDKGPLAALLRERRGEVVIVAGRNEPKLAAMRQLHEAGLTVLADKPWITHPAALPDLDQIMSGPPTVLDIMTGRHDVTNRLCHRIISDKEIFGDFAGEPALLFASVHHLCKMVDGRPLIRPAWYYDVTVQGDGMVDIHSHLVDQAQWLVDALRPAPESAGFDAEEIAIVRAERWSTEVPLADFTESTGLARFPDGLADRLKVPASQSETGPALDLACNGRIDYRLRGVLVRQETVWRVRAPDRRGDEHTFTARGSRCTVAVDDGQDAADRPELRLVPTGDAADWCNRLLGAVETWQDEFPGLAAEALDVGHRLIIPEELATPHEAMFTAVLDAVLDQVERGEWSSRSAATIRDRYTLLARAHQSASG